MSVTDRDGHRAQDIRDAAGAADMETVRELLREYQQALGISLCFQGFADELRDLPGDYRPPTGRLLIAFHDAQPIGCVALRSLDHIRGEMKRLYVRPAARGLGAGRALVDRLLAEAAVIGYAEIVLDTLPSMTAAQRMYRQLGFRDIPPYCANPVDGARYLGLALQGG